MNRYAGWFFSPGCAAACLCLVAAALLLVAVRCDVFRARLPAFQEFFASLKRGLVVEQNHQSQLFRLLRMFVDVPRGIEQLAKSGSNPITPGEVVERLKQISLALQRERQQEPSGV